MNSLNSYLHPVVLFTWICRLTHLIIIIIIIFCNKLTKRLKNVTEISKTNRNEGDNKENGEKFLFTSGKKKKRI